MSLLTGLVSYWDCGEASGNLLDVHGSNNLTDNASVGSGTGIIGNARDLESISSQYFSIADNTDLSTGDIDFTFSYWIKLESGAVGFERPVIAKRDVAFEYYTRTNGSAFQWQVQSSGGTTTGVTTGTPANATWYHVVVWHDSVNNVIGIALNAGTPATAAHSLGVRDGASNFHIGKEGANYFDGLIDEVGFWKRVLTSQERTDLYNGGAGLAYSSFGGGASIVGPLIGGGHLLGNGPLVGGRLVA